MGRKVAVLAVLMSILTSVGLISVMGPAAAAGQATQVDDLGIQNHKTWGPVSRNCLAEFGENCRVAGEGGTGVQEHYRNSVKQQDWLNTAPTFRVSFHGSGNQTASIKYDGALLSQSAVCWCGGGGGGPC